MNNITLTISVKYALLFLNILYIAFYVGVISVTIIFNERGHDTLEKATTDILGSFLCLHAFLLLSCVLKERYLLRIWLLLAILEILCATVVLVILSVRSYKSQQDLRGSIYISGAFIYPAVKIFHFYLVYKIMVNLPDVNAEIDINRNEQRIIREDPYVYYI